MKAVPYFALLAVSFVAAVATILTLVPAAGATYENVLGYRSFCTFAPAATFFCAFIAGLSCVIRASYVKRRALYGRPTIKRIPIIVLSAILLLGFASTIWFKIIDARYPDATTGASPTE